MKKVTKTEKTGTFTSIIISILPEILSSTIISGITFGFWYWREEIKHKHSMEGKRQETDDYIRKMSSRAEYEKLKKSQTTHGKESAFTRADKCPDSHDGVGDIGVNFHGKKFSELVNYNNYNKWIVDGYMACGLVNFCVAGSGVGKSIFLYQIALAVAHGDRPAFLPPEASKSVKLHVVFYRVEDYDNEIIGKYGSGKVFDDADIEWFTPEDYSSDNSSDNSLEAFTSHLRAVATQVKEDTLVCIDPATKLYGYRHESFIKGVDEARNIAKRNGCTITILASLHHEEIKDWKFLTNDTIRGGDTGIQQAGSVTAIRRERTSEAHRFLQCLKAPKGYKHPLSEKNNTLVVKLETKKIDESNQYVHFRFDSIKPEAEALPLKQKATETSQESVDTPTDTPRAPNQKITSDKEKEIKELLDKGVSQKEIADKLGVCSKTISRYKNRG